MVEVWTAYLIISSLQDFVSIFVPLQLGPLIFNRIGLNGGSMLRKTADVI